MTIISSDALSIIINHYKLDVHVYICDGKVYVKVYTSDVNNAEIFNAEPRHLVILAQPRLSFSIK